MSEELYFNNELRKCLNAAGLSDCGENDQWNYWYQRVHKAHDQAIDRVTEVQRTENARLRELCVKALEWLRWAGGITCPPEVPDEFADELRELGIEELDA